nr:hypothetical protein [Anaerolineae bacterium]
MTNTTWLEDDISHPSQVPPITRNDRLSTVMVFVLLIGLFVVGTLIRQRYTERQWTYTSSVYGFEALYPAGWLTDEQGDYIVSIRDPGARPFKTEFRISVVPVGIQASTRNVLDTLTIQRSANWIAYRVLGIDSYTVGNVVYTQMDFVFVETDNNPFVQQLPAIVLGRDILIRDGSRVIVVSYLSGEADFEKQLPLFERFLESLRY